MIGTTMPELMASTITLQVTDACNLRCSYCYQANKSTHIMTYETGKKIIDLLFKMYSEDKFNMPINKQIIAPVIFFMGGEPLLNVPLIQQLSDYFVERCEKMGHPWLEHYMFRVCTNGTLYFQENFQQYLRKYKDHIHLAISLDGTMDANDACRFDQNKNSDFETTLRAVKAYKEFRGFPPQINMVIAPQNLPYLGQVYDFLLDIDCTDYGIGPIVDYKWTVEEAREYYKQLKFIADRAIQRPEMLFELLDPRFYYPLTAQSPVYTNNCTGMNVHGLVFTPDGKAYTCLRFAPCTLSTDCSRFCIGSADGLYNTPEIIKNTTELFNMKRKVHYDEECLNCPISAGCNKCAAIIYQDTGGFIDTTKNECWIHRAASLAAAYYWNMVCLLVEKEDRVPIRLPKDLALQIISEDEYNYLVALSKE